MLVEFLKGNVSSPRGSCPNPVGAPYGGYFSNVPGTNYLHPHEVNQLHMFGLTPIVRANKPIALFPERSVTLCSENMWKEI